MTADRRPDADELLARIKDEERRAKRGKLTIFFGAAPGVGKTYDMLEAARTERDLRRDVVVGIVETHGRYETAALTIGLELLPRRKIEHSGVKLEELDLDAVLARRPGIVLVDELAHTNAPESRHAKRWQDVEELLEAGVDVYTTVNVQHIESLNDVVAQITGVIVRETVPDRILDQADEIRLVDLPPAELLDRLADGKVYMPEQARRAMQGFFKKGSLTALRELALRKTADRVDEQVRSQKRAEGVEHAWPVAERILVCVSPSPASARLIRAARRIAAALRAPFIAVYVEGPAALRMSEADRERVAENLRLAEQLGAETVRLSAENAAHEVIAYARSRNVTRIIVGKPTHPRWRDLVTQSFLEQLVRGTPDMDIHVVSADKGSGVAPVRGPRLPPEPVSRAGLAAATVTVVLATGGAWLAFGPDQLADVVMTYLLGIVLVSMRFGYGPSIFAAVLSVVLLDFFFVPPLFSFSVTDLRHVVTFVVMFVVAVVISRLTKRIRDQADGARQRELHANQLYAMSRELAGASSAEEVLRIAGKHLGDAFDAEICVLMPDAEQKLVARTIGPGTFLLDAKDGGVGEWVWRHGKTAGRGTDTLPSATARFLLLRGARERIGVLAVKLRDERVVVDPEQRRLLETFASPLASALERVRFEESAKRSEVEAESERLRSSLLSSVSHLLDMTRIASGAIRPKKEWHPFDEIIGVALNRLDERLRGRTIEVRLPEDLPPIPLDSVLVEQILINLLENALKYAPSGSPLEIRARANPGEVEVEVADRGPGVPASEKAQIFEKFYRLKRDGESGGAGLGLAICRGVVEAHGGRIWVEDREGGGASFRFTLPIDATPPRLAG